MLIKKKITILRNKDKQRCNYFIKSQYFFIEQHLLAEYFLTFSFLKQN
jgi:hypothetical protein